METTRRNLVVNLTEQEITDCSKELARITTLQAEIEEEKKTVTSSYKEKLDRCISESRSLARKISTRQDYREVDCEWRFDYTARVKRLIRTDTYEEVETRKLSADELQEELKFDTPDDTEAPVVCPKCEGDGEYYGDEGQVYCDCPAGAALKAKEEAAATEKSTVVEPVKCWNRACKKFNEGCRDNCSSPTTSAFNEPVTDCADYMPEQSTNVETSVSLCATCMGDCSIEDEAHPNMMMCEGYTSEPLPAEIERRDSICNEWRECNHTFRCFGPANDETGLCFRDIEKAKGIERGEETSTAIPVDPLANEHGVYVNCERIPINIWKKSTSNVIHVVQGSDGFWRSSINYALAETGGGSLPSVRDFAFDTRNAAVLDAVFKFQTKLKDLAGSYPQRKKDVDKGLKILAAMEMELTADDPKRAYPCPQCDFTGESSFDLVKHLRAAHNMSLQDATRIANHPEPETPSACRNKNCPSNTTERADGCSVSMELGKSVWGCINYKPDEPASAPDSWPDPPPAQPAGAPA